jgi:hypothetical protein
LRAELDGIAKQLDDIRNSVLREARIVGATVTRTFLRPAEFGAFDTVIVDEASMILSPRSFHRYIPSARTTIWGSDLNSRFGVNGIQYSSSERRFDTACSWIVSSAWPIVFSFLRSALGTTVPGGIC